jgi:uncharacterized protein (UPF0335 family)
MDQECKDLYQDLKSKLIAAYCFKRIVAYRKFH